MTAAKAEDAACTAAEAMRLLIHETQGSDAYTTPSDVDAVLIELQIVAGRLPQALAQAGQWISAATAAGRVGHDDGADVPEAVDALLADLIRAVGVATDLAALIDSARQVTSHLTAVTS